MLDKLYHNTPSKLNWPKEFIFPYYGGRSIADIPASIADSLGLGLDLGGGLEPDLLIKTKGVDRVLLLLVDGLGFLNLQQILAKEDSFLKTIAGGKISPITSIFPSTTCVATTSFWVGGQGPAQHGLVAFNALLADYGLMGNLLFWQPWGKYGFAGGSLETYGLQAESFLPVPSFAHLLAEKDIPTRVLMPQGIDRSPLSRLQMRGAEVRPYTNATDMWWQMGQWLKTTKGQRGYGYTYYPDIDSLYHREGVETHVDSLWPQLWQEFT
ncbi:MAG: alkaline phosphatase family protein, partial [Deinococcales bacterium]